MAIDFDPYLVLGITPEATVNDIKAAYRRAARRLHPDKNQGNPGAIVQFQDISVAHELLLNDEQRRAYDAERRKTASRDDLHFNFRVTPSKRAVSILPESQVIYLLAEIIPDARATQQVKRESRLNLTLVLDQSNSMSGTRLEKVKIAANQIIDQLTPDDVLSVVAFNDFAEVIIPATTVTDKPALKARVTLMGAGGGTEIFKGLSKGLEENRKYLAPRLVNHIILLTDGNTFGDEEQCRQLAKSAADKGVSISAMGLGQDWNDRFLDDLASITGGTSQYIQSSNAVVRFLNDHVRSLANIFAERVQISIAPDPDVKLEYAFRLAPNPQPLPLEHGFMQLGSLQYGRTFVVLFQLELPADLPQGFRSVARLIATGDIFGPRLRKHYTVSDISIDVLESAPTTEPPPSILDALGKLTLYRLQERAQEALERGDTAEATKHLQRLSTRLIELGQPELAREVQDNANIVSTTSTLSEEGKKALKYQTRFLLGSAVNETTT